MASRNALPNQIWFGILKVNEDFAMTQEELQKAANRHPFEPFRVIVTTGATYDIRHPELIMVGRRSAVIGITNEPGESAYDHTIKVDLLHVVGIEDLPLPTPSSNNGPPK